MYFEKEGEHNTDKTLELVLDASNKMPEAKILIATTTGQTALKALEATLGQYGYAGQIGQNPVPPSGGMFKVNNIPIITEMITPNRI